MNAPERLLDDPFMSDRLKVDLARVRDNSQVDYDVSSGAAVFRRALERIPLTVGQVEGAGSAASQFRQPLALKLIVGGLAAAGLYYYFQGQETETISTTLPPVVAYQPPETEAPARPPAIASGTSLASPPRQEQAQLEATVPPNPRPVSPQVVPTMMNEVAQLKQVRLASKSNPHEALRLAREGHQQFPDGLLYEEREGLLILSLQKLNQVAEAKQRAALFKSRYPKSALLPQISNGLHQAPP